MARGWKEKTWVPSVLVLHEHHGTVYLDASTETSFQSSIIKILRGRMNSSDWYQLDEDKDFRDDAEKFLKRFDSDAIWELLHDRRNFADECVELVPLLGNYMKE
jgi:hypothetical protein